MTPQSQFTVLAPLAPGREPALRTLLGGMTTAPGVADPHNSLVPFGELAQLHFARFVILSDPTVGDIAVYGVAPISTPPSARPNRAGFAAA